MLRLIRVCWETGRIYSDIKSIYALAAASGLTAILTTAINYLGGLLIIGPVVAILVTIFLAIFLASPKAPELHTPRYLDWFKFPLRRISFNFDNYLGLRAREGKGLSLGSFQSQMKVNWGRDIQPMNAYIKALNSGSRTSVLFRTGSGYLAANETDSIPSGRYFGIAANFEDLKERGETVPVEDFLKAYSGFEFVLEWEGGKFRRKFSRAEIETVIDGFRKYSNPAPDPEIAGSRNRES